MTSHTDNNTDEKSGYIYKWRQFYLLIFTQEDFLVVYKMPSQHHLNKQEKTIGYLKIIKKLRDEYIFVETKIVVCLKNIWKVGK